MSASVPTLTVRERLDARSDQVAFRPEVPKVIDDRFQAVRDLLRDGDRSASFADVAFERALLAFELALRCKHGGQHGTDPADGRPGVQRLYRWAVQKGHLDRSERFAMGLYSVRNAIAHPTANLGYGGPGGAIQNVFHVVDAVNDLFEPREQKRERRGWETSLDEACANLTRAGTHLSVDGVQAEVWKVEALYAENRLDTLEAALALWPRFSVPEDPRAPLRTRQPLVLRPTQAVRAGGGLDLVGEGDPTRLQPLRDEDADDHARWRRTIPAVATAVTGYEAGRLRHREREDLVRRVRARWSELRAEQRGEL